MRRSHARTFREALQLVPKVRKGPLLKASLPELSEYGRTHPAATKVSPGTVNNSWEPCRRLPDGAITTGSCPRICLGPIHLAKCVWRKISLSVSLLMSATCRQSLAPLSSPSTSSQKARGARLGHGCPCSRCPLVHV